MLVRTQEAVPVKVYRNTQTNGQVYGTIRCAITGRVLSEGQFKHIVQVARKQYNVHVVK